MTWTYRSKTSAPAAGILDPEGMAILARWQWRKVSTFDRSVNRAGLNFERSLPAQREKI